MGRGMPEVEGGRNWAHMVMAGSGRGARRERLEIGQGAGRERTRSG